MDKDLKTRALHFAREAHASINHRRKYSGEPYIVHPQAVAAIVEQVPHSPEMLAAALLHDVVEDTPVTLADLEEHFPAEVCELVFWLTDVSRPEHGNRRARKAMDRAHIAKAPAEAKTVKLADLIHNAGDIMEQDPHFARVYMHEMAAMLEVLGDGDAGLLRQARALVDDYFRGRRRQEK